MNGGLPWKPIRWCLQFGLHLMSKLMWPLTVYEITITHVEHMQLCISIHIWTWLFKSHSLAAMSLYNRGTKMKLCLKALTEEYKVATAKLHMTFGDSKDQVVYDILPYVQKKWM